MHGWLPYPPSEKFGHQLPNTHTHPPLPVWSVFLWCVFKPIEWASQAIYGPMIRWLRRRRILPAFLHVDAGTRSHAFVRLLPDKPAVCACGSINSGSLSPGRKGVVAWLHDRSLVHRCTFPPSRGRRTRSELWQSRTRTVSTAASSSQTAPLTSSSMPATSLTR